MNDRELVDYIETHARTELGQTHRDHVARLLVLAGRTADHLNREWYFLSSSAVAPLVAEARLRQGVKQLAEVRGWLNTPGKSWDDMPPWLVHFPPSPLAHVTIASWVDPTADHGDGGWHVDPLTALLWSLLVGLDVAPVDVGACLTCVKRGSRLTLLRQVDFEPCATCSVGGKPTGRDFRSPARLLLDASHEWGTVSAEGEEMGLEVMREVLQDDPLAPQPGLHMLEPRRARAGDLVIVRRGDAKMREHLAVLADQWQGAGVLAGEWISLWLAGWPKDSREVCTKQMLEASAKL